MSEIGEGACVQAHQLVKMRVSPKLSTPQSPLTPIALPTPLTPHSCVQEECVLEDLQLAAELGKTLLERNRELEHQLKQLQGVIDDQTQEIEYLSKQTTALKEVNDSRLRIYEQLEISIQELEKNNQRLGAENSADKKKIKSLCVTIDSLEGKVEDLQKQLEEARTSESRSRQRKKSLVGDEAFLRRSISCEPSHNSDPDAIPDDVMVKNYILELEGKLKDAETKASLEAKKREEIEIELACQTQANGVYEEQLAVLRDRQMNLRSIDDELTSVEGDSTSSRLCSKCMGSVDETGSNATIYDLNDIEDTDMAIESTHGECALIKLKNGGYAWGSQESLASMGRVLSQNGSNNTSPNMDNVEDRPQDSLLFELDTQYRILIEKYETLLASREQQQKQENLETKVCRPKVMEKELVSGPVSFIVNNSEENSQLIKCENCATCSCSFDPTRLPARTKSNTEEFSETETSSSGFSDGDCKVICKFTQTEAKEYVDVFDDVKTPTALLPKSLDLASPINPCDKRFQATPEYKKLFQEIFSVLKQNVEENTENNLNQSISNVPNEDDVSNTVETTPLNEISNKISVQSSSSSPREEKLDFTSDAINSSPDISQKENVSAQPKSSPGSSKLDHNDFLAKKPPRPDSLDLISNSSRSSSKSRRRKRMHKKRIEQRHAQAAASSAPVNNQTNNDASTSGQRQARKDLHNENQRPREEFTNIENQKQESRVFQSSNRGRCDHHKSRKNKNYNYEGGNYYKHHRYQNQASYRYDDYQQQSYSQNQYSQNNREYGRPQNHKNKIGYPSVEVAKLRKLEMSYAEVLKKALHRPYNQNF